MQSLLEAASAEIITRQDRNFYHGARITIVVHAAYG